MLPRKVDLIRQIQCVLVEFLLILVRQFHAVEPSVAVADDGAVSARGFALVIRILHGLIMEVADVRAGALHGEILDLIAERIVLLHIGERNAPCLIVRRRCFSDLQQDRLAHGHHFRLAIRRIEGDPGRFFCRYDRGDIRLHCLRLRRVRLLDMPEVVFAHLADLLDNRAIFLLYMHDAVDIEENIRPVIVFVSKRIAPLFIPGDVLHRAALVFVVDRLLVQIAEVGFVFSGSGYGLACVLGCVSVAACGFVLRRLLIVGSYLVCLGKGRGVFIPDSAEFVDAVDVIKAFIVQAAGNRLPIASCSTFLHPNLIDLILHNSAAQVILGQVVEVEGTFCRPILTRPEDDLDVVCVSSLTVLNRNRLTCLIALL